MYLSATYCLLSSLSKDIFSLLELLESGQRVEHTIWHLLQWLAPYLPGIESEQLTPDMFHTGSFTSVWEVQQSCLAPCTSAKPTWLGFLQSVTGLLLWALSNSLLPGHHCQRRRSLSQSCNQPSQKLRVWKNHHLLQDYQQLQAVTMIPNVRFFMERKFSGFCELQ